MLLGKAKMRVGPNGEPLRMLGTVQDVTEGRKPNASTGSPRRCSGAFYRLLVSEIATLVYLVLALDSGMVRLANAGHPPPLVVAPGGQTSWLADGLGSPPGCDDPEPVETVFQLVPGSTLLLFTDGLVEKRGVSIQQGLARLEILAADCDQDIEPFCEMLLGSI